jgi:hypothetical protein
MEEILCGVRLQAGACSRQCLCDRLGPETVVGELGGVVVDEGRPLGRGHAAGGCREVAGQDLSLVDPNHCRRSD